MSNNNVYSQPYAKWLEQALKELVGFPVKSICLNAVTASGDTYTNYYQISMRDKIVIAGILQQDAMLDTMAANGIIEYDDKTPEDEEQPQ